MKRRDFLKQSAAFTAGVGLLGAAGCQSASSSQAALMSDPLYKISLAQWSLHKAIFAGELDHLDFAKTTKESFGIDAVEYVNVFFKDKARDEAYLQDMLTRTNDLGVQNLLIMCDGEGNLGDPDEAARVQAVENHHQWVEAAKFLGCHSIRVNARSDDNLSAEEQMKLAADGLHRLCEFADSHDINVIVENHGGLSSNGAWLAGVMEMADHERVGTLPDFGNFCIRYTDGDWRKGCDEMYDRYEGVAELMPYAKAVSAKTNAFDAEGNEKNTDYKRMMQIVLDHDYHGYVGIEYEGSELSEMDGIRATQTLLQRVRDELAEAN